MPADILVLRAARNAFLFVLLALVGVSTYQFATTGGIEPGIAVIWIVGAGGFYGSKWYYERSGGGDDGTTAEDSADAASENRSEPVAKDSSRTDESTDEGN